jgi:hypothetical protein
MVKKMTAVALFLTLIFAVSGCQKNFYSGSGKGSNCGCPAKKGMVGY